MSVPDRVSQLRDRTLWILAAMGVALAAFATMGLTVLQGGMAGIDVAVREWGLQHRSLAGDRFFGLISFLGAKSILAALGVAVGWFVSGRKKVLAVLFVLAAFVTAELVDFLKAEYRVLRPLGELAPSKSFSFPSGHVSGTASIATLLSYVALRHRVAGHVVVTLSVVMVVLMAMSRVYLDMHWTSDVVGGALIGAALGVACAAVYEIVDRHLPRRIPATPEPARDEASHGLGPVRSVAERSEG